MGERNNKVLKRLDQWIGCPLLFLLGTFRYRRERPGLQKENPSFLLVKTAAMGDTILVTAVIREIKAAYPESKIVFVCAKSNLGMVKTLEGVDGIYEFQMKHPVSSLCDVRNLGHFDFLLDFGPWPRINGLISYMADAGYKVGFKRQGMYRHYVYDKAVLHSDELHEVENYRNILRETGIKAKGFLPRLYAEKKAEIEENYVVFHLFPAGSCVLLRQWSEEKWIELSKEIYEKYGYKVLLSGGKEDTEIAERIADMMRKNGTDAESIAGRYGLRAMRNILAHAKLLVSVNTGIMHMGAAVGVPLVALHGATSVKRWGPLCENVRNVWAHEPCQPCISLGFESKCKNPVCMQHITVAMVMDNVREVLCTDMGRS